ncbi:MAG: sigma-54 interaction domain-containing protein [Desulfococcaceae bacterium]
MEKKTNSPSPLLNAVSLLNRFLGMKNVRYHISYYVIIPGIFAGYSALSSVLTYRLIQYCLKNQLDPGSFLLWPILGISLVGFLCGLLIFRVVIEPLQDFMKSAQEVLPQPQNTKDKSKEPVEIWKNVFKQVKTVLSLVDARKLFPEIIAESEVMRSVLGQITKVAPTESTVLITGESGTGKELVSASIYRQSKRADKIFVKLNCVATPKDLWESELFGHEKGAFTGATAQKIGKFEHAHEGTLFLDEIGDMPLETQAKLLRVLQEREFERVGGNKTIKVDVRFIAATNKNLPQMIKDGTFREDLFFRINVFIINLPPLRERKEDIPLMAEHFCSMADRKISISPLALQMLKENSDWPGNVRELKNIIERATVMCEGNIIEPDHLPDHIVREGIIPDLTEPSVPDTENGNSGILTLDEHMAQIEKSYITKALERTGGIQVRAAKLLGIKERALWHRIKKHNIDAKFFKG